MVKSWRVVRIRSGNAMMFTKERREQFANHLEGWGFSYFDCIQAKGFGLGKPEIRAGEMELMMRLYREKRNAKEKSVGSVGREWARLCDSSQSAIRAFKNNYNQRK